MKKILTIVLSLGIGFFFMWLATRGLEFEKIKGYFSKADYFWVFLATIFGILAYWFRAIRWNILFEPLGHKVSTANSFWSISFGYLMNLTIPRSGELARATALYKAEKVPVDQSFGTIILERVVDMVCMLGFLLLTLIFKYEAIHAFYVQSGFSFNPVWFLVAFIAMIAGGGIFFAFKKRWAKVPFLGKIIGIIDGILSGLGSVFKLKSPVKFILYTGGIWLCYYFAAYLVFFALPETSYFTWEDGLYVVVVGTLGMMIPASGGIGAFHYALKMGIGALFLSWGKSFENGTEVGLAYAFISHTMQFVIMLVMGLLSIFFLARNKSKKL